MPLTLDSWVGGVGESEGVGAPPPSRLSIKAKGGSLCVGDDYGRVNIGWGTANDTYDREGKHGEGQML